MSKRRVRRKRRARVNILPLILVGAVIAGVITVVMSVNLKGADKEPPTEEIHITETPLSENTEPVTEQEAKLEHDLNYTYPYNTMSADWGAEVYEEGFRYYEIPQEYKDAGGCFPEIVQVYLWCECKEYGVDYYTVVFTGNYVWQNYTYNGFLIAGLGGRWDSGSGCGFGLAGNNASGSRYRYFGGRLLYVPQTKVA